MYSPLSILAVATGPQLDQSVEGAAIALALAATSGSQDDAILAAYHYDVVVAEVNKRIGCVTGLSGGSRLDEI